MPSDHLRYWLLTLAPWVALYTAVTALGIPSNGFRLDLPYEERIPILSWTEPIYLSIYLVLPLMAFLADNRETLRLFMVRCWFSMAVAFPLFLVFPVLAPRRPFVPIDALGHLLAWRRQACLPIAAFPSFHVIFAILVAEVIAARGPRFRWPARIWALLVSLSCLTTGMHALLDLVAGAVLALMLVHLDRVWPAGLRWVGERRSSES